MAQFNENFIIASPNPADRRYLSLRTLGGSQLPYSSVTEVYNVVIPAVRYSGQTVLIRTGGTNVEYWFKNGVANSNLIEKKYDSTLPLADYVTGGTNLGFFSGYTGVQTLPIDHLLDSNYDGNYRSLYNYYYRGTDGKIHIGVPNDGIEKRGYVKTTPLPVTSWIWNEYIGDASVGWMPIMGNIANQVGTFQPSVLYYPPSIPYTATSWNTGSAYNNGSNLVVNTVLGSLTTGTTLTIGGPPFAFMEHNNLHFRTIMTQTPNTLAVSYTEPFINLSGATFGASGNNLGIGAEVYKNTTIAGSNSILNFRTLVGSGGTHVHEVGDYIYIESSGGSGSGISYNFIGSGATKVTTIGNNVYIYSPSGNSESISKIITQPSHPFNPGEVVGFSGGTYNQPIADGTYNGEIIGLTSKYIDANTFEVTQAGFVSGLTGLVASTTYFLSAIVAGQLTATEPTGNTQISKAVIIATSTTSGWVLPYPGYYITSGVTLSWNNLQNKPQWLSANTLNEFQTGHTHSYINLTNKPTFIGSGNTVVIPSGNSYIIFSSGASSLYNLASPSAIPLGGMCVNTVLTGKTAFQLFEELLVPELCGTITPPSIGIGLSASGLYEIGCTVSQTVTGTFSRGCINPQYCSLSDKRSGCANAYDFTGCGMPVGFQTCTSASASQTNPSYTVSAGTQSWGVCTRYDAGCAALGSKGNQYCAALVSGCTSAASNSIVGVYPLFATTSNITTLTSQALQNMSTANNIQINLCGEVNPDKQKFEIPCAWLSAPRPLTGVRTWVGVASAWCYLNGGTPTSSLSEWTPSPAIETVQGNSIGYCQYTFNGIDRSATCIRLEF